MRIVWKLPDGSIQITKPYSPRNSGETEAAYLDRIATRVKAAVPALANAVRVADISTEDHMSLDRTQRGKWAWDENRKKCVVE